MVEVTSPSELAAVAERLRGLVAGIDPAWVTSREAPGLWSGLEDIRRLASGGQVVLADLVDKSTAPAKAGLRNGAEWIAQQSGGSLRSAYDQVTTAKRLADLPDVTAALRDGRVSTIQASVIADAAAVDPSAETQLMDLARRTSLGELRREALRVKAAADPDPDKTEERIRRERRLRWFVDNEGAFNLSGRGPLTDGGELSTVLGPIIDDVFAAAHEAGITEPREAYTWDALVEMARMAWAYMHGQTPDNTTDDTPDTATADTPDRDTAIDDAAAATNTNADADDRVDGDAVIATDDNVDHTATGPHNSTDPANHDHGDDVVADVESAAVAFGTARGDVADDAAAVASQGRDNRHDRCSGGDARAVDSGTHPASAADRRRGLDDPGIPAVPVQAPKPRRRKAGVNPWARMLIRVEHSALVRGWVEGEETCDVAGLGTIPVRVARELLGEATLYLLVSKGRDVTTVAYLGRGQNAAQKIASSFMQPECQRLGCHRPVMEWDHRVPYAHDRVTRIDNIDGLCKPDHLLKTRDGWELTDGTGKRPMVPPDDPRHPHNQGRPPPPPATAAPTARDETPDPERASADHRHRVQTSTGQPNPSGTPHRARAGVDRPGTGTGTGMSTPPGPRRSPGTSWTDDSQSGPRVPARPPDPAEPDDLFLFDNPQPDELEAATRSLLSTAGV